MTVLFLGSGVGSGGLCGREGRAFSLPTPASSALMQRGRTLAGLLILLAQLWSPHCLHMVDRCLSFSDLS